MHEASYYKILKDKKLQCFLCPRFCVVDDGQRGFCGVRENRGGKLFSLAYEQPAAVNIDPIEKKPLYHFLPGTKSFSIGTVGCNLNCRFCQNWDISRAMPEKAPYMQLTPKQAVEMAIKSGCKSISYTYNEPTIFLEYVLDIAKLAKKNGLKNVLVSNGYINPEPLADALKVVDAANIDLKAFTEKFYSEFTDAKLKPVLEALKLMKKCGIWIEITNLILPTKNDNMRDISRMSKWIRDNIGKQTPLHFSRFFPMYKMIDAEPTPEKTLFAAQKTARKYLDFVYIGNIGAENNTLCPKCQNILIERKNYTIKLHGIHCTNCGKILPGVY
ncbi:MAG: AmmeMemoRadiSam system radical SAM enzyme [Candidatus Woesearchaeota archaeon]